jgi:hypothetical protein
MMLPRMARDPERSQSPIALPAAAGDQQGRNLIIRNDRVSSGEARWTHRRLVPALRCQVFHFEVNADGREV